MGWNCTRTVLAQTPKPGFCHSIQKFIFIKTMFTLIGKKGWRFIYLIPALGQYLHWIEKLILKSLYISRPREIKTFWNIYILFSQDPCLWFYYLTLYLYNVNCNRIQLISHYISVWIWSSERDLYLDCRKHGSPM